MPAPDSSESPYLMTMLPVLCVTGGAAVLVEKVNINNNNNNNTVFI